MYRGFEGFQDPTEEEVLELLRSAPVILDANVLLDIYTFEEPARVLALSRLEVLQERAWVPHQALLEFWRNRQSVISTLQTPGPPLEAVRSELFAIVNGLRPDRERPDDIQQIRNTIETQLTEISDAVSAARGTPLDVDALLADTSRDPVLERLEGILEDRVGAPFESDEYTKMVQEGLDRFALQIPPGYEDLKDKKDQIPERGTGDFLLWEQSLRHVKETGQHAGFVIVTNDKKDDWRVLLSKPRKRVLGVRPELVSEALNRTGAKFVLLTQSDFYRLMAKLYPGDDSALDSLIDATTRGTEEESETGVETWTAETYGRLISDLRATGNHAQAAVIILASAGDGFVDRAAIYASAGFAEERSLRRFSLPAQRAMLTLIEEGVLREESQLPLEAIYERPGKTIGYRVPADFVEFEAARMSPREMTWISAAVEVASQEKSRGWSVAELIDGIRDQGLKDFSSAKTPEATLRRDLNSERQKAFTRGSDGLFTLSEDAEMF
ncbi:PIN-like domain-containing protein [Glaciihabitans sp. dw_435]|uniref:PIN-like domain-containing protein n=1 Tax=Glaciihabitans sp. dw_435 TaxID=2720081 RepID=UPI0021054B9B|nr:PIN-like domain-containing protein [Glaciihabitans sp. dw_435]